MSEICSADEIYSCHAVLANEKSSFQNRDGVLARKVDRMLIKFVVLIFT